MPRNEFTCDCNAVNETLVKATLSVMPDENVFSNLACFYKLMGDPTRCKLIFSLTQAEMCVCDLANVLSMTKSSISHQLSKMKTCGIVKCRREGKEVYYSLDDAHVSEIYAATMAHIQHKHFGAAHED